MIGLCSVGRARAERDDMASAMGENLLPVVEGWLYKQGGFIRNWKKRCVTRLHTCLGITRRSTSSHDLYMTTGASVNDAKSDFFCRQMVQAHRGQAELLRVQDDVETAWHDCD